MQAKIGMDVQTTTSPVILKNSKLQHENGSETPYNMPINSIQSMGYELFGVRFGKCLSLLSHAKSYRHSYPVWA